MTTEVTSEAPPRRPSRRMAPGTHPLEAQRLALQEQHLPGCDPLKVQATIWIFRAFSAVNNAQAEELRPLRLSPSAFNVLMALLNTPDHVLEPCQLADRLLVSRPSITGLLDTLQSKGLIVRRPHAADGRRVLVELTEEAHRLLHDHVAAHYAEQERVFADLSPDELATLVELLRRVQGATPAAFEEPGAGD
jgi:DNA-binding MarR family transcriptional regulator